jgi:parallel beta-helix repeat protein
MANARVLQTATAFAIAAALITIICFVFCSTAFCNYQSKNNYLDVAFGETSSDWWNFMYAPETWGDACYREHFGVFSRNWNTTKSSDYDFQVDQRFDESSSGRTARLHYEDLNVTREVYLPDGDAKFFTISYTLTNTNRTSKLEDVRLFEVVDFDIVTSGDSYGWYANTTDTVWQNNDQYFRNGFGGDRPSSNHGMEYYGFETGEDWSDGELNGLDKYPENGTADVAVGMQWNAGDLAPGQSWQIVVTFYFGGSSGIFVDAGPEQTVGRNRPVVLDASRSTSVGSILHYEWDLNGDGTYDINVSNSKHTYPGWRDTGVHTLTLRATDDGGRNATAQTRVTVIRAEDIAGAQGLFDLVLTPDKAATSPGGDLAFKVSLTNGQPVADSFTLNATGLSEGWIEFENALDLGPGMETEIPLKVSVPDDASDGNYSMVINATSYNLGGSKDASADVNITSAPQIEDLLPEDNSRTGSQSVAVSWKTPVNASGDVFIKSEDQAEFHPLRGMPGKDHAVVVNLTRNELYEFYVKSETSKGASQSDIRQLFVDNGISFDQKIYDYTINRDYNQSVFISVTNTDDEPHELLMQVSGVPEDLALNFVGQGSTDQKIALLPGESRSVELVFHAQDALSEDYAINLNLTNLGAEAITDSAVVNLHVHFPVIDYSLEEIASDPYTLGKTLRITNKGDPLTDLSVSAGGELSGFLVYHPSVDHAYLGTGQSLDFVAEPVLAEGFSGAKGLLAARAAGEERNISLAFTVPPGKSIFVGQQPAMTIAFDKSFDDDDLANTNPSGEVESYTFKSGDKSAKGFIARVKVLVEQNGAAAYKAQVVLNISGNGNYTTIRSPTDLWGQTIFTIYGLPGDYTYEAFVEGSDASTESRNFSVSSTPSRTLEPGSVAWVNAKDATATTDLSAPESTAALNAPPYIIRAKKAGLPAGSVPVLYLANLANYSFSEIVGESKGGELVFNLGYADPGNYTATIAVQSFSGIATSDERHLTFTGQGDDITFQNNYTYELPYPVNDSAMAKLTINNTLAAGDPHKVVRLLYVLPDENSTRYNFTYLILADRNMTDTLRVTAKDRRGKVVYEENRQVELVEMEPLFLEVPVPVYYEDGRRIEGLKMELEMQDYVLFFSDAWALICDPGAFVDGETWKTFFRNGMLTPNNRPAVFVKCFAGFVPGVNTVVTFVDAANNGGNFIIDVATGKPFEKQNTLGPMIGGVGQLSLDPILDLNEGRDTLRIALRDKLPLKVVQALRDKMLGKSPKEQLKILKDEYLKQLKEGKKLTRFATGIGILANIYSNYDDWKRVTEDQAKKSQSGQVQSQSISVKSCINHAPLKNKFETPSYIPRRSPSIRDISPLAPSSQNPLNARLQIASAEAHLPNRLSIMSMREDSLNGTSALEGPVPLSAQNIEGVYVRLFFAREPPAEYKPFNTSVRLNGHIIGNINNTVPQGNYVFKADPSWLNYAEQGAAENSVTLDVDGMNRGYYVPLDGYKIDILFKEMRRAVCASSQEDADDAVMNMSGAMARKADLAVTSHNLRISPASPNQGDNLSVDATVQNLGSLGASGVKAELLADDVEADWQEIPYLDAYSSQTVNFSLPAEIGSHNIKVRINPEKRTNESDYSNNEASRSYTVTGPDSTKPTIGNLQPPDGSSINYNLPLISADLGDSGTGINTSSVRISVDGIDVTGKATTIPSRIWYTPKEPLSSGNHQAMVAAEDNAGNREEKSWSFTVSSDSVPPQIKNPQPPDGSTVGYARPLISAALSDDSGIDTSSVAITVDRLDVTSKAKVLPSKVWYTPEEPLQNGDHSVTVKANDQNGNHEELSWSFRLNIADAGDGRTGAKGKINVCPEGCDYSHIQDAIEAAAPGSIIEVRTGNYQENVNITKPLKLIGVDLPTVDAGGKKSAITLSANGIVLQGFRAVNSAESGIDVLSSGNMISDNHVSENQGYGINLYFAGNNTLEGNAVSGNGFGIYLGDFSLNNSVRNNTVHGNSYGIYIDLGSYGNVLYLNDLQENSDHNAYDFDTDLISTNQWDNGLMGNYFGDNACLDSDENGICDEEYAIPGGMSTDRYPRSSPDIRAPGLSSAGLSTGLKMGSTTADSTGTDSIGATQSTFPPEIRPTELMDHGMALDVEEISSSPVSLFYTTDDQAVSWVEFGPVYRPHEFEWYWYSPDGELYNTYAVTTDDPQNSGKESFESWMAYSYMSIYGNDAEYILGDWWADVYMDGEYLLTEEFSILSPYDEYPPYGGYADYPANGDYGNIDIIIDAPQGGWETLPGQAI